MILNIYWLPSRYICRAPVCSPPNRSSRELTAHAPLVRHTPAYLYNIGTYVPYISIVSYFVTYGRGVCYANARPRLCSPRATQAREWYLQHARRGARVREGVTITLYSYVVILLAKCHAHRNKFARDVIL